MNAKEDSREVSTNSHASLSPQERRIRDLLAQKRWRKARDETKPLCKIDRPKYLPLLIEANLGLAHEMLSKGLVSDARQVLAYLKTIATQDQWKPLELDMALKAGDYSATVTHTLLQMLGESEAIPESEKWGLADRLVLAFQTIPDSEPNAAHLAQEASAVHQALEAVSLCQFENALEAIQPLAQNSPFRQWKLFVKGLVAFHRNDRPRAKRFFAEIAPETTPSRALQPYLYWLNNRTLPGTEDIPEHAVLMLTSFAGESWISHLLYQAQNAWRNDKPWEMYQLLRKGLESFPSEKSDGIGAITEFCFHCLFILPSNIRMRYAEMLSNLEQNRVTKNPRELKMILRVLCLYFQSDPNPSFLAAQWKRFIQLCEKLDGSNPRRASLAYTWLGDLLTRPYRRSEYEAYFAPAARPRMMDPHGAVRTLRTSIELDPENREAHLRLAAVFEESRKTSERNRLLDDMTRRFPDDKQVLLLAGDRCIHRKAFAKGIEYLERALQHDRMDPAIPAALVTARIHQAREHFKRGRADKAREALDKNAALSVNRADDFLRSRWTMLLRRGLLEILFGDFTQGQELIADARAASPDVTSYLFLAHLLHRLYAPEAPVPDAFAHELEDIIRKGVTAPLAGMLIRILAHMEQRRGAPHLNIAIRLVRDFLRAASRSPFTRDEARQLSELIGPHSRFAQEFALFVKKILERDRDDPLFRLYQYQHEGHPAPFEDMEKCRRMLDSIMREAVKRKEDYTIARVQKEMARLKMPPPNPIDDMADGEDDEDFDEDDLDLADELMRELFRSNISKSRNRSRSPKGPLHGATKPGKQTKEARALPKIPSHAKDPSNQQEPAGEPDRNKPAAPKPEQRRLL